MCGIIGILLANRDAAVNQDLYDGLTMLQHRGQDAAGMIVADKTRRLYMHKDCGLVRDVFKLQHMINLVGYYGIAHCRYPTAGASSNVHEAQPFMTNIPFGLCLAHNGNITNTQELREALCYKYHFNTDSDSELMLSVLADELLNQPQLSPNASSRNSSPLGPQNFFNAVQGLMARARGGYAAVLMINGHGLMAFRDPNGIRPLCFGKRPSQDLDGWDYFAASESVGLEALRATMERDVRPGEAVWFGIDGTVRSQMVHDKPVLSPCIFEYVYFGRPDSVMDGVSVYRARQQMGNYLADKIRSEQDISDIDVVCPVPDTSRVSAVQCALRLGLPYEEGLNKNRYIARTFIMPGQQKRKVNVRKKLNPIRGVFEGKRVLLIDDSIVRGTTSTEIISMCREAGALKVYFCSASPPVRYPNVYGIDMPVQSELVAYGRNDLEIAQELGADWVVYSDAEDMEKSVKCFNSEIERFDCSCFTGEYVTGDIDDAYFQDLINQRSDQALVTKNQTIENGQGHDVDNMKRHNGTRQKGDNNGKAGKGVNVVPTAPISPASREEIQDGSRSDGGDSESSSEDLLVQTPKGGSAFKNANAPPKQHEFVMGIRRTQSLQNEDLRRLQHQFSGWS